MKLSQAQVIGMPRMKTWDDYRHGCLTSFGGGYKEQRELDIFHHGIETVFNLLQAEFPPAEEIIKVCNEPAPTKPVERIQGCEYQDGVNVTEKLYNLALLQEGVDVVHRVVSRYIESRESSTQEVGPLSMWGKKITYDIDDPGDMSAGIWGFSDTITIMIDSRDPGCGEGEFEEFM